MFFASFPPLREEPERHPEEENEEQGTEGGV